MISDPDLSFNRQPSTLMHLDLNSCFATIEQQANPFLRGKAIAVAAYATPSGCILAPSVEAKRNGVRVGQKVREARLICPGLMVLPPDPWKYRYVHLCLKQLLSRYSPDVVPKSIDEFVINFENCPGFNRGLIQTAIEIKQKIKSEIGDWLTVSVGIGPNRFLAKQAAGLEKPDGLVEINFQNFSSIYQNLSLPDLHGIKQANTVRLNSAGIFSVADFYRATIGQLRAAFRSVCGYYWYLRLRGWEIDDIEFDRRSFGNMFSLPRPLVSPAELSPILHKLVEKCSFRMRRSGYCARGVHLAILYRDHSFWHRGFKTQKLLFGSSDIYKHFYRLLISAPHLKPVANLAVSCFNLLKNRSYQLDLFQNIQKKFNLISALDKINQKWGDFVIIPATMLGTQNYAPDRIAFGNIQELEQFVLSK